VDLEGLRRDLAAGEVGDIFLQLVGIFVASSPAWLDAVIASFAEGRMEDVRRATRAYKSRALSIRADRLAIVLHAMERGAIRGDERCIDLLPELVRSHRAAQTQLILVLEGEPSAPVQVPADGR